MEKYDSFETLDLHLRQLNLQRQIVQEELKGLGHDVRSELHSLSWIKKLGDGLVKYGAILLLRKLFRK